MIVIWAAVALRPDTRGGTGSMTEASERVEAVGHDDGEEEAARSGETDQALEPAEDARDRVEQHLARIGREDA